MAGAHIKTRRWTGQSSVLRVARARWQFDETARSSNSRRGRRSTNGPPMRCTGWSAKEVNAAVSVIEDDLNSATRSQGHGRGDAAVTRARRSGADRSACPMPRCIGLIRGERPQRPGRRGRRPAIAQQPPTAAHHANEGLSGERAQRSRQLEIRGRGAWSIRRSSPTAGHREVGFNIEEAASQRSAHAKSCCATERSTDRLFCLRPARNGRELKAMASAVARYMPRGQRTQSSITRCFPGNLP